MKNETIQHIESLVQMRKTTLARKEIRSFLRKNRDGRSLFAACEWFRRLGLYKEGLALVAPKGKITESLSSTEISGQKALWTARFLNSLGASSFAMQIVEKIKLNTSRGFQQAGEIFLANFNYESALKCFETMYELEPDRTARIARIGALGLSDSLAELGELKRAREIALTQLELSDEPIIKGICLQVCGEYFARQGKFREALKYFAQATEFFPTSDETIDRALLLKWQGYALAKSGDASVGMQQLKKSILLFKKLALREEAWLDALRLKHELNSLSKKDLNRLFFYPGLSDHFKRKLPQNGPTQFGNTKSATKVYLDCDEHKVSGSLKSGIPLELRLAAWLRVVENWGISQIRACTLLWQQDFYSFDILEQRLFQLIKRLRQRHQLNVFVKNQRIFLDKSDFAKIWVQHDAATKPPSFLQAGRRDFVTRDIATYYDVSIPQALKYLEKWQEHYQIEEHGLGRSRFHRFVPPAR